MYNLFLETLEKLGITAPKWFFWIVLAVIILIGVNFLLRKYVKPIFEGLNDMREKLQKTDEIDILKENQLRNVEHYKAADAELRGQIKEISDKVSVVANMIIEMQSRADETNRAKLKDRIREAYAIHHPTQKITKMEREALEDLIKSYELANGKNSFVHSLVEPELYCWELVDDDYYERERKEKLNKGYMNEI